MWKNLLVLLVGIGSTYQQCFETNPTSPGVISEKEVTGITEFGFDVYKQLLSDFGYRNMVFSPYSLWNALLLTYFGTSGTTQAQLESALRVKDKASAFDLKKGLDNWYLLLQRNNPDSFFGVANRLYFDVLLNIRPCIRNILRDELQLGYLFDGRSTARYINDYIQKATRGRIEKVASPRDFENVHMVIVNAAAFKGTWKYEFKSQNNTRMLFNVSRELTVNAVMMRQQAQFRYGESDELGARILELPYTGEQISMFLLLPRPDTPFEDRFVNMVHRLNSRTLGEAIDPKNLDLLDVDLALPRFNFSSDIGHHLEKILTSMGIVDIFNDETANLTGFTMKRGLSVSQALHKSFVEVNEEGTEATGVTAILISSRSSQGSLKPMPFHLLEPFVFLICERNTRSPLFLGHVKNPFDIQRDEL
ncbi:serpin B8-like [Palaemon carinicauda]|uniref:serpin B8-like n=1 Tax=Palaemon carinicauda TaxID=392227 RepID=UPI0035B693F3